MQNNIIFPFRLESEGEQLLEKIILDKLHDLVDASIATIKSRPMTPEECAQHFDVSQPTIDKWVKMGMPKHKEGSIVRYYTDEVDAWFKELGGD